MTAIDPMDKLREYCAKDVNQAAVEALEQLREQCAFTKDMFDYRDTTAIHDEILVLHYRLELFVEPVWAEQIKIALHNFAKTTRYSYLDLLQSAVETVIFLHRLQVQPVSVEEMNRVFFKGSK